MSHPSGNLAISHLLCYPCFPLPGHFLPLGTAALGLFFSLVNGRWGLCPGWGLAVYLDPPNPGLLLPKICVEKCPDRYLTYLNAQKSQDFEYYKQFCVPGFQNNKVRGA